MGKILLRIHQFADNQGLSIREIERSIGVTNGLIAGAIRNNREIGSDKVENILQTYEQLSAEWLLRGEGEMLKQNLAPQNDTVAQLIAKIAEQAMEIQRLQESKRESAD